MVTSITLVFKNAASWLKKKTNGRKPTPPENFSAGIIGGILLLITICFFLLQTALGAIAGFESGPPGPECGGGNIDNASFTTPGSINSSGESTHPATSACLASDYSAYCTGSAYANVQVEENSGDIYTPIANLPAISSNFGWRINPVTGHKQWHSGADYPAPTGTPLTAIADGTVVIINNDAISGNGIRIKSMINGIPTFHYYGHLVEPSPYKVGDKVKAGDVIGKVGSTGRSTGPHLHFEITLGGAYNIVDPHKWLIDNNAQGAQGTVIDPATGEEIPLALTPEDQCANFLCSGMGTTAGTTGSVQTGIEAPEITVEGREKNFVSHVYSKIGYPYVWGGESDAEGGYDCSGLIYYAASKAGITGLPRTADAQMKAFKTISASEIKQGDLYYCLESDGHASHVGMIASAEPGKVIKVHAPKPGSLVEVVQHSQPSDLCWGKTTAFGRIQQLSGDSTGGSVADISPELGMICSPGDNSPEATKEYAKTMMAEYGWNSSSDFACLDYIATRESSWDYNATNPSSGATGIGQCNPSGGHDCDAPPYEDYEESAATQVRWMLDYIDRRYGTPCKAKEFWVTNNWY